ncbi:MAG: DUF3160 domain-containing protein [Tissierellia bacterium]|nr:DUF3160 domain-containing protein [Tissierellia bacterium]
MKKMALFLAVIMVLGALTSCVKISINKEKEQLEPIAEEVPSIEKHDTGYLDKYNDVVDVEYSPLSIAPEVRDYTIAPDLSNVANIKAFGEFTEEQKEALVNNGFFIAPTSIDSSESEFAMDLSQQLFYVYESNEYKNIPSFVTTDSVLHMYHIFYDNFLKSLEEQVLHEKLVAMTKGLLAESINQYELLNDGQVKDLALKNCALFGTELLVLKEALPENMPEKAAETAGEEFSKIQNEAAGISEITGLMVDYSQFKPRGHYTKSEKLQEYFKGVMLFGQMGYFTKDDEGIREDLVGMSFLMTDAVYKNKELYKLWSDIFEPINFLVEAADDLGPKEYAKVLYGIYGEKPDLDNVLDKKLISIAVKEIEALPGPEIADFKGHSFRLMPQRAVIDSTWMQRLLDVADPGKPSNRPIYSGLDIMAALGSETAKELQLNDENNKKWDLYPERLDEVINKVSTMEDKDWQKNLYRGWIWTIKELAQEFGEGYPKFMQNEAWRKKDLNSGMGSWMELKHDTVLYGKQPIAEAGGGGYREIPKAYVEPNIRVYEKLSWLIEFTKKNLESRQMLPEYLGDNLDRFKDIVDNLVIASDLELKNQPLTADLYDFLNFIGGSMERISLRFVNEESTYWSLLDEGDRDMAIAVDLMQVPENTWGLDPGEFLSVGVGNAHEIFVIYPVGDELQIGRGAVFSYREFLNGERITNEEWREKLKNEPKYGIPYWMEDSIYDVKSEIPYPEVNY